MSKTIWIHCKQVVEFNQQHTVTDKEYEELMKVDQDEAKQGKDKAYDIIEGYIDYRDVLDSEPEFTDISIELDKDQE